MRKEGEKKEAWTAIKSALPDDLSAFISAQAGAGKQQQQQQQEEVLAGV